MAYGERTNGVWSVVQDLPRATLFVDPCGAPDARLGIAINSLTKIHDDVDAPVWKLGNNCAICCGNRSSSVLLVSHQSNRRNNITGIFSIIG
jgi:hypothetical protein